MVSSKSIFSHGAKTDIFEDIRKILKDYNYFLAIPILKGFDLKDKVEFDLEFGQAIFVKKDIKVVLEKTTFVYGNNEPVSWWNIKRATKKYLDVPRNMQYMIVEDKGKRVLIGNLHGFWMPRSKGDTPQRIKQSLRIKRIFDPFKGPKILCGDFNLVHGTKSMKMLEEQMKNLVTDYGLQSTRSRMHKRKQKFADYILVSKDVKVNKFKAVDAVVSDHLPLYLDFSI
jgi:endonuclease/exonuclease/phosphatase family metal-dependent hydrolase